MLWEEMVYNQLNIDFYDKLETEQDEIESTIKEIIDNEFDESSLSLQRSN